MTGFALWILGALVALVFGFALANWWVAERDEKRWRRRWVEEQQAAMIREYRYGSHKRGQL